jgi:hypothetical protein
MQLFGITGPRKHPGQALDGAAGMDRDYHSLTFLQGQLVGKSQGAMFVDCFEA